MECISLSSFSKETQARIREELAAPRVRKEIEDYSKLLEGLTDEYRSEVAKPLRALIKYLDREGVTNVEKTYLATSIARIEKSLEGVNRLINKVADTKFNTHRIDLQK